ncbi:hypothetical protein ASG35_11700 [Burkholderia sp. Leaf177]|uniref:hypothetical protein n=1 Tax=Burkholderia sp. Leaf177 TaxID=1736287 RepID=UPI0006F54026|nr:hypothetical protein [Burkholderia sp. Leaf177]KQR76943.1 hypothetical protein ASG35_11700 [Burkholderia sp. Leaf177]
MTWQPPITFDAWEKHLVERFLKVDDSGDSTDIRSFEVTATTLADALGAPPNSEAAVVDAFQKLLHRDPLLVTSLSTQSQRVSNANVPCCFVYLAATLFVDSMLDGEDLGVGAFREKLAKWLDIDNSFPQLKGIASMWEMLRDWINLRLSLGEPYRRVVLPDPGAWTHIGYTRRLSFPNRSDARALRQFIADHPTVRDRPLATINLFDNYRLNKHISWGLNRAFEDFRDAYFKQRRALADHRFWRLMCRVSNNGDAKQGVAVEIDMLFEEDGSRLFVSPDQGVKDGRAYQNLTDALVGEKAAQSINLSTGVKKGILFFRASGLGRWSIETDPRESYTGIYVALALSHEAKIGTRLGPLRSEKKWLVTSDPISVRKAVDALISARLLTSSNDHVFRTSASDGIRVGGAWLGRPRFLPRLDSDTERFAVTSNDRESELRVSADGQFSSEGSLNGSFTIRPALVHGESQPQWSLRLAFTSKATPHAKADGARYRLDLLKDWPSESKALRSIGINHPLTWEEGEIECGDLIEALYADGASGWEEAALIQLLVRACDSLDGWSLLRILHDAGLVEPRLRGGWRGRNWTLIAPHLLVVPSDAGTLIVIEGAVCESLVDSFRSIVDAEGGTCFRRLGVGPWSPPTFGAVDVSAERIAERLDWPIVTRPAFASAYPLGFEKTERLALAYEPADFWDWRAKRFLSRPIEPGTTTLSRLVHVSRRDHDLFKVASDNRTVLYLSRTAAIVAAHAAAGIPLFRQRGEVLVRIANDGGLPDALANDLRRRQMRTAGIVEGVYAYPSANEDVQLLRRLLPRCIESIETVSEISATRLLGASRRSEGRTRPVWRNGKIIL